MTRRVRALTTILVLIAVLAMRAIFSGPTRRPLALRLLSVEPGAMVDDAGVEALLVDLQITNRDDAYAFIAENGKKVEARSVNRRIESENDLNLSSVRGFLRPRDKLNMLLVLPGDAEVCRLTLNYQIEPLHYRLWRKLAPGVRNFATRILPKKFISEISFWPSKARKSGCKAIVLEVELPKKSATTTMTSDRTNNKNTKAQPQ